MNRRPNAKGRSDILIQVRVTSEEHEAAKALAAYKKERLSELIRRLLAEERARLVAEGHRPPRRIRE